MNLDLVGKEARFARGVGRCWGGLGGIEWQISWQIPRGDQGGGRADTVGVHEPSRLPPTSGTGFRYGAVYTRSTLAMRPRGT
jgi:hypothetical protein